MEGIKLLKRVTSLQFRTYYSYKCLLLCFTHVEFNSKETFQDEAWHYEERKVIIENLDKTYSEVTRWFFMNKTQ